MRNLVVFFYRQVEDEEEIKLLDTNENDEISTFQLREAKKCSF